MMTASPNRRYSRHHKTTEEEGDYGILGKETWRKNVVSGMYSWRKMEPTTQNRAGWRQVVAGLCSTWCHKT